MTRKRVNQKKCATVPVKRAATKETAAAASAAAVADSTCGMCGSTSPRCSCCVGAEAGAK